MTLILFRLCCILSLSKGRLTPPSQYDLFTAYRLRRNQARTGWGGWRN